MPAFFARQSLQTQADPWSFSAFDLGLRGSGRTGFDATESRMLAGFCGCNGRPVVMPGVDPPATTGVSGDDALTGRVGFAPDDNPVTEVGLGRNDGVPGFESKELTSLDTL